MDRLDLNRTINVCMYHLDIQCKSCIYSYLFLLPSSHPICSLDISHATYPSTELMYIFTYSAVALKSVVHVSLIISLTHAARCVTPMSLVLTIYGSSLSQQLLNVRMKNGLCYI